MVFPPCPVLQDEWYRRAELALGKGDEELAREALSRRKSFQVQGGGGDREVAGWRQGEVGRREQREVPLHRGVTGANR